MITHISLKNFVIMPALELAVPAHYTALTGETGAGKSILIDALQLALGQRADSSVVYEGAQQAEIALEFAPTAAAQNWLQDAGFQTEDSLLIRRVVEAQGKSRAWINGSAATLTQLRELGDLLVDIHGQHAWASLAKNSQALTLLDAYAKADTSAVRKAYHAMRNAERALAEARDLQGSLRDEQERLQWQLAEVDKLKPGPDEWEALNQEHSTQSHAQDVQDAVQAALAALDGEGSAHSGAAHSLQNAAASLAKVAHLHTGIQALHAQLTGLHAQAADALHDVRALTRSLAPDQARLAELDARVAQWLSLARRYKCKPEALPELALSWQDKLAQLGQAADLDALQAVFDHAQKNYTQEAERLHTLRKKWAPKLEKAITQAMQGLGMAGGQLHITVETGKPQETGSDAVEFLVAGHAGVSPKPVSKVASGGELSRIALAIAVITAQQEGAPTLIFDEVDSGIGGAVAHAVGALMRQLGASKQVLAVTHLAQVAAPAHQHWRVEKVQAQGKTSSRVTLLAADERVSEIARMLGGDAQSATSRAHAAEMLAKTTETV